MRALALAEVRQHLQRDVPGDQGIEARIKALNALEVALVIIAPLASGDRKAAVLGDTVERWVTQLLKQRLVDRRGGP